MNKSDFLTELLIPYFKEKNIHEYKEGNNPEFIKFFPQKYRIKQIIQWIFEKNIHDFNSMTNLPRTLRDSLAKKYSVLPLEISRILKEESTSTTKFELRTLDNNSVEMVILDDENRYTLCISSQIGCAVGCKFCATGQIGFLRNLTYSEIITQVLIANQYLSKNHNEKLDNIVFMGMGEPLLNLKNVLQSIHILHDPDYLNISSRKITISTSGIIDKMDTLKEFELPIRLSFSLHAGTEKERKKLIPYNQSFGELLQKLAEYYTYTKKRVTLEYICIENETDTDSEIDSLIKIAHTCGRFVNLIEYNEVEGINFKASSRKKINEIKTKLEKNNINTAIRYRRGREIKGACGQLVWKKFT